MISSTKSQNNSISQQVGQSANRPSPGQAAKTAIEQYLTAPQNVGEGAAANFMNAAVGQLRRDGYSDYEVRSGLREAVAEMGVRIQQPQRGKLSEIIKGLSESTAGAAAQAAIEQYSNNPSVVGEGTAANFMNAAVGRLRQEGYSEAQIKSGVQQAMVTLGVRIAPVQRQALDKILDGIGASSAEVSAAAKDFGVQSRRADVTTPTGRGSAIAGLMTW